MTLLPDVAGARVIAEAAMVDTCAVYRDAEGSADDTLDLATGALTPTAADDDPFWTGPCLLRTATLQAREGGEGGAIVSRSVVSARVPVSAPVMLAGDILVVTAATNDAQLVGRRARIVESEVNTFAVTRKLRLEDQGGQVVR